MTLQSRLIGLLALLVALAGSHWYALNAGRRLERSDWLAAQIKSDAATSEKYNAIAQQLEEEKNARQIITQTITKKIVKLVDRPIYRNNCLDASGLLLLNSAITGKAAGEPVAAVPAATAD